MPRSTRRYHIIKCPAQGSTYRVQIVSAVGPDEYVYSPVLKDARAIAVAYAKSGHTCIIHRCLEIVKPAIG
jgi:hypothetical protein